MACPGASRTAERPRRKEYTSVADLYRGHGRCLLASASSFAELPPTAWIEASSFLLHAYASPGCAQQAVAAYIIAGLDRASWIKKGHSILDCVDERLLEAFLAGCEQSNDRGCGIDRESLVPTMCSVLSIEAFCNTWDLYLEKGYKRSRHSAALQELSLRTTMWILDASFGALTGFATLRQMMDGQCSMSSNTNEGDVIQYVAVRLKYETWIARCAESIFLADTKAFKGNPQLCKTTMHRHRNLLHAAESVSVSEAMDPHKHMLHSMFMLVWGNRRNRSPSRGEFTFQETAVLGVLASVALRTLEELIKRHHIQTLSQRAHTCGSTCGPSHPRRQADCIASMLASFVQTVGPVMPGRMEVWRHACPLLFTCLPGLQEGTSHQGMPRGQPGCSTNTQDLSIAPLTSDHAAQRRPAAVDSKGKKEVLPLTVREGLDYPPDQEMQSRGPHSAHNGRKKL